MKTKKKIAWLLSFVMVIVATMSGNVIPVRALTGTNNIEFQYDNTSLEFGEIQWKDSSGDWHTQTENGEAEATAVRIRYGSNGALANHTELRNNGTPMLADNAANKEALESETGLALESNGNYCFEHIEFIGSPSGPPPSNFDGIAYFVWRGANDALCVHEITGLDTSVQPDGTIDIIYIPVSDVKDDTTQEQFAMENNDYYWLWSKAVTEGFISNYSTYSALREALESNEDTKREYAINPCGAENGESTICTNGDREFRATIYDSTTFEGVEFSNDKADYIYFPDFWDPNVFSSTVDISGSTAEHPAVYESFLSEPAIHFGNAANSVNAITGIRALDVPAGAVTISGSGTSGYDIRFGSNFFDNVVFEITTANETYYLEIVRTALQVHDTMGPGSTDAEVVAEVYYEENESYDDYDVYATIYYQDGSTSIKKLAVSEIEMDMMGNPLPAGTYELDGGDGLKLANFNVQIDSSVVGVYFNAVKSGALTGNTYGGSYFGSGNGVYYDIESRDVIY